MINKNQISFFVMLFFITTGYAQSDAHFAQYMFNGLYTNPAYAGSRGGLSGVGIYRHQWQGMENGPRSVNLSLHAPIEKGVVSVGAHLNNDRLGNVNMNSAFGVMAFRFKFSDKENATRLALGVQAGFKHFSLNNKDVLNSLPIYDPAFSNNFTGVGVNTGVGLYIDAPNYFIGFSLPYLLFNDIKVTAISGEVKTSFNSSQIPIVVSAGYVFSAGSSIKIKPSMLLKYQAFMPVGVDLTLGMHIKENFYIGGSYRIDNSGIAMMSFNINEQIRLGYAYEFATKSSFSGVTNGTHEILVGFDIVRKENKPGYCNCRVINPRQFRYF